MAKRVTTKNYAEVIENFKFWMRNLEKEGGTDAIREICKDFDNFLEELRSNDAFGTEGQLDPRGDQRD